VLYFITRIEAIIENIKSINLLHLFIGALILFFTLFLLRPKMNWGDSDWVMMMLRLDAPIVSRWLTSIKVLNFLYQPLSALLFPKQFVTIFFCILGVLGIAAGVLSIRAFSRRENIGTDIIFLFFSFAVVMMCSGYLEIYSFSNFGIVVFLMSMIGLLKQVQWMNTCLFGIITSTVGFMYMGNMPLFLVSLLSIIYYLLHFRHNLSQLMLRATLYFVGITVGMYLSFWILTCELVWSPQKMYDIYKSQIVPLTKISLKSHGGWYMTPNEMFSLNYFFDYINTWLIYGFSGFILFGLSVYVAVGEFFKNRQIKFFRDGIFMSLLLTCLIYLFFSYIKRPMMGFKDWDAIIYIVYPINLLAVYSYSKWLSEKNEYCFSVDMLKKFTVIWCFYTFLIMNPISEKLNVIPPNKQIDVIYNYNFFVPTEMTPHLETISSEIRKSAARRESK